MSRFDRQPPIGGELSPRQLEVLFDDLTSVLNHRGRPKQYRVYPPSVGEKMPLARVMLINPVVQKEIFNKNDDLLAPKQPGIVRYSEPYRVDPLHLAPDAPVYEQMQISLDWRVGHSQLEQQVSYWIEKTDGVISCGTSINLVENGRRISPRNIKPTGFRTSEELIEFINDFYDTERPLNSDDAAKIQLLTNVLR